MALHQRGLFPSAVWLLGSFLLSQHLLCSGCPSNNLQLQQVDPAGVPRPQLTMGHKCSGKGPQRHRSPFFFFGQEFIREVPRGTKEILKVFCYTDNPAPKVTVASATDSGHCFTWRAKPQPSSIALQSFQNLIQVELSPPEWHHFNLVHRSDLHF